MKGLQKKKGRGGAGKSATAAQQCVNSDMHVRWRMHTEHKTRLKIPEKRSPIRLEGVERSRSIYILIASEELSSHTAGSFVAERNAASFQMDCVASQVSFNFSSPEGWARPSRFINHVITSEAERSQAAISPRRRNETHQCQCSWKWQSASSAMPPMIRHINERRGGEQHQCRSLCISTSPSQTGGGREIPPMASTHKQSFSCIYFLFITWVLMQIDMATEINLWSRDKAKVSKSGWCVQYVSFFSKSTACKAAMHRRLIISIIRVSPWATGTQSGRKGSGNAKQQTGKTDPRVE